jgi:integration host factor subunit alpha
VSTPSPAVSSSSGEGKLTKAEIIEKIHAGVPVSKKRIQRVIDFFIEEVKLGLREGKIIELRGFGTFEVKVRKRRRARNPRTGEKVDVEDHGVPLFRPGKEMREQTWSVRS